jgi:hypothetical protein
MGGKRGRTSSGQRRQRRTVPRSALSRRGADAEVQAALGEIQRVLDNAAVPARRLRRGTSRCGRAHPHHTSAWLRADTTANHRNLSPRGTSVLPSRDLNTGHAPQGAEIRTPAAAITRLDRQRGCRRRTRHLLHRRHAGAGPGPPRGDRAAGPRTSRRRRAYESLRLLLGIAARVAYRDVRLAAMSANARAGTPGEFDRGGPRPPHPNLTAGEHPNIPCPRRVRE